jgi:hypothetical protein
MDTQIFAVRVAPAGVSSTVVYLASDDNCRVTDGTIVDAGTQLS